MSNNILVIGGGIGGLYTAIQAQKKFPASSVTLLERGPDLGGLLRSFDYSEWGKFDIGIHTIYETGDSEIDNVILGDGFPIGWRQLPGDWGGVYWKNKLTLDSPYLNLTHLPEREKHYYSGLVMHNLKNIPNSKEKSYNAKDWAEGYFGNVVSDDLICPILEKIYKSPPNMLSALAVKLLPLNRIICFQQDETIDLMASALFRSKIAIPNQRMLPKEFSSGKRGYYPSKIGMHQYVDWLKSQFISAGGNIYTDADIQKIEVKSEKISSLHFVHKKNTAIHIDNIMHVFWAAGIPAFGFSGLSPVKEKISFDPPMHTAILNLVIKKRVDLKDAQYIYVFENRFLTFRIAIYENFTDDQDLNTSDARKISLEILATSEELEDNFNGRIHDELKKIGLIHTESDILFSKLEKIPGGFPKMSTNNLQQLEKIRSAVITAGWKNFDFIGVWAKDDIYFQVDILKDAKEKIEKIQ